MKNYPKIKYVEPIAGKKLLVTFIDNTKKIYDCTLLLREEAFKALSNNVLFRSVKVDKHGYGVIWSVSQWGQIESAGESRQRVRGESPLHSKG